jgi:putative mRNA 3-end processing factor
VALFPDRSHLVGGLCPGQGAAPDLPAGEAGYDKTIYIHGALAAMNALYEAHGVKLGSLAHATDNARNALPGEIVLAPPSAIAEQMGAALCPIPFRLSPAVWMAVRARARQRRSSCHWCCRTMPTGTS